MFSREMKHARAGLSGIRILLLAVALSLLAAVPAKLSWLFPPVPTMNSRMPLGVALPFASCGAKRS